MCARRVAQHATRVLELCTGAVQPLPERGLVVYAVDEDFVRECSVDEASRVEYTCQ